jgi:hypothetical protein
LVDYSVHVVRELAGLPRDVMDDDPPGWNPYRGPGAEVFHPFIVLAEGLGVRGGAKHQLKVPGF